MSDIISFEAPEPEELSTRLDSYEIHHLIAVGGMGAVYHATQTSLDREVAIKLLPKEFGDETFREQFAAEARAMAKLNHPNLIAIFDYGKVDGNPYIVMEYVPGKSLYYSCYEKAIEQDVAIRITSEICAGLAHAHDNGIVHRDIKPANSLLDGNAHAKIGDFGLVSAGQNDGDDGIVYGTPGYVAPEVLEATAEVGQQSDIFAVGVILHQLLTGKMPDDDLRPPSRISKTHMSLDRIVRKATHKNLENRYQNCGDMLKDLAAIGTSAPKKVLTAPADKAAPAKLKRTKTPVKKAAGPALRRLEPSSEPAPSAAPEEAPPVISPISTSNNWPLIRNLMIIAVLIPALIFAWGKYQEKEARITKQEDEERIAKRSAELEREATRAAALRDTEEQRIVAAEAKKRRDAELARIAEMQKNEPVLTPLEQLAKIRTSLAGGARDSFPEGTITRGSIRLFFVETPMTWSAATEFCEAHGGHLTTPILASDLAWTGGQQGDAPLIWLGGGALGSSDWGWVTGETWEHKKPSTSLGTCAAMTASGIIKARPNGMKLPFFIQWENDGSNAGSLDSQLERLKGTLGSPSPAWPPGTLAYDGRNYLLIQRSLPWDEADLIATSTGGHLAVASNTGERIYLSDTLSSFLTLNESAWLGGKLKGDAWTWITGETWTKPQWRKNSPDGSKSDSALRFTSAGEDSGWDDADPDNADLVSAFFIEWSNDAKKAPAKATGDGMAELAKTKVMGAKLLRRKIAEHTKRLQDNQKDLIWEINGWLRSQPKSVMTAHSPAIEALKNALPDSGFIPADLNVGSIPRPTFEMLQDALSSQTRFDNQLKIDTINLRNAFLGKLLAEKAGFEKANLKTKVAQIDAEIQSVGQDTAAFRAYFGID